jgi:group I intron endonuclease
MITNRVNKKRYIGKSINLLERIKNYLSKDYLNSNPNSKICEALLKFDNSQFYVSILELCDADILSKREQHFINIMKPQYNIRKIVKKSDSSINSQSYMKEQDKD